MWLIQSATAVTDKIFNSVVVFGVLCGIFSFVVRKNQKLFGRSVPKVSKINLYIFVGTFALVSLLGFVMLISRINVGQTLIEIGHILE